MVDCETAFVGHTCSTDKKGRGGLATHPVASSMPTVLPSIRVPPPIMMGTTLLEVVLALTVTTVAVTVLSSTVLAVERRANEKSSVWLESERLYKAMTTPEQGAEGILDQPYSEIYALVQDHGSSLSTNSPASWMFVTGRNGASLFVWRDSGHVDQ